MKKSRLRLHAGVSILQVEWTRPALADLIEAQSYIARENPHAAQLIGERIWRASQSLGAHPYSGREGHVDSTREWVVQRTPYLIVYRVHNDRVEILHVYHGKQNWQDQ